MHRLEVDPFTTHGSKSQPAWSFDKERGIRSTLEEVEWTEERLEHGVLVKLKKVPFKVRLFKVVATNGNIDWVITHDLDETVTTQVAQEANVRALAG